MSDQKKEKKFWERRFNISNPKSAPESIGQFGWPESDIDDDDLEFLTRKVKRIDILMLRESNVTNEGISYLSRLEFLRELDIKSLQVSDTIVPHLLNLSSLEYLHIKFTDISAEGVRQLVAMPNMKKLVAVWPKERREEGEALVEDFEGREIVLDYK